MTRALAVIALLFASVPAVAQSPFSAAVRINNAVVTHYEIDQRVRFMSALNAQGDLRTEATEALVNERLQRAEALRLGVLANPEAIESGLEEFAGRAGLSPEQFLRQMGNQGIAPETIRDFVANGISWRNVVQSRFGASARPNEAEVDRALELGTSFGGGIEILLAEIIIPVTPQNRANLESELGRLGRDLNGNIDRFSEAARRFSAAPTRENGGLTGWRSLNSIPENLRNLFEAMGVGQVTAPVPLGGGQAFAIFQLRGQREIAAPRPVVETIDYVTIAIPGGRSPEALAEAARLAGAVDTCGDFNGVLPGGFERQSQAPGNIPSDIAAALNALDDNEMSTQVTRSDGTVLLAVMLCDRVMRAPEGGMEQVANALFGQRLEAYAASYLDELRADATILYEN